MIVLFRLAIGASILLAWASGVTSLNAETRLPPGRTGGNGSNQAAGPSGQNPGQVGEIGGAGPHPGPSSTKVHRAPDTRNHAPERE